MSASQTNVTFLDCRDPSDGGWGIKKYIIIKPLVESFPVGQYLRLKRICLNEEDFWLPASELRK